MIVFKSQLELILGAKDAHIAALNAEIAFLRGLLSQNTAEAKEGAESTLIEANALLDGSVLSTIEQPVSAEERRIAEEANRLLTGTY